ncbi:MAG: hypothetical protein M1825_000167 [Sarcosagium campestre]|nr:MAG: hypothetical protein M1825_000167 [Sarcosagium campestre]
MARGANSFATFLILCPTSFFLGMLFAALPYDFPVLWTSVPPSAAFYDQLETHLRFVHAAPPLVPRVLHIMIAVGLIGFISKLYKPSEANTLFDGASLFLYMCGVTVYISNIVKGLRQVSAGLYGDSPDVVAAASVGADSAAAAVAEEVITREDSLKVIAASNTILALVLIGVLVLQAGQWYAERKEAQELAKFRHDEKEQSQQQQNQQQQQQQSSSPTASSGGGGGGGGGHRSASGKKKQ